jgi:uridine phosphorylase
MSIKEISERNFQMVYPKFKGKHSKRPLFSVEDYKKYIRKVGAGPKTPIPEGIILCYSRRLSESIQNAHRISEIKGVLGNIGSLYSIEGTRGKVGLLAQFGVGAPATVIHVEELNVWGAKRFVILGMAGGISSELRPGDIVVCTKSIRDEGASHHYLKHSKYSFASKSLTKQIYRQLLNDFNDRVLLGPSWTIDAPYRETIEELKRYRGEGILTVEMEASALFAVGKVKAIETAAVFVISDVLTEKNWKPAFRSEIVLANLLKAFSSVKQVLAGR